MGEGDTIRCTIVSDFNAQNFVGYLNGDADVPRIEASVTPFGQVMQTLTDFSLPCWNEPPEVLVVWTQPHRVLESFNASLEYSKPPVEDLVDEVDEYCQLQIRAAEKVQILFVPTWVVSAYNRGLGSIDLKNEYGIANRLTRANLRLVDNLQGAGNVYVLNAHRWMELAGARNAHNPKLWYMGKIGFGNEVFKEAVKDVKAAFRGIAGQARKLVILDLDDTLWGGVVGDVGWEGLRLGGHDPIGEAFADFQAALKALKNRGILLGIVSKNEEGTAIEAHYTQPRNGVASGRLCPVGGLTGTTRPATFGPWSPN